MGWGVEDINTALDRTLAQSVSRCSHIHHGHPTYLKRNMDKAQGCSNDISKYMLA